MSSARLVWEMEYEQESGVVVQLDPELLARYGEALAEIIAVYAHVVDGLEARARGRDVRHSLERLAEKPGCVPVERLCGELLTHLQWAAERLFEASGEVDYVRLQDLPPASIAACARDALSRVPKGRGNGRPPTQALGSRMVAQLLAATPGWSEDRQRYLIADALGCKGLRAAFGPQADDDTVGKYLQRGRKMLRSRKRAPGRFRT